MEYCDDYYNKKYLNDLITLTLSINLDQIVKFDTWSRTINGVKKSSILDHVYTNAGAMIDNLNLKTPDFGDHVLVIVTLSNKNMAQQNNSLKRNWKNYTPDLLLSNMTENFVKMSLVY